MRRIILNCLFLLILALPFSVNAQQNNGGSSDGVKNTCEVSGGTFTGSEGGNWACCWSDWGCYGCVDGNCKMQCRTTRCRKANAAARPSNAQPVRGLSPTGAKPPVAPLPKVTPGKLQNN